MIERLPYLVAFYFILLFSLSVHEAAHAWMSNRRGDPTARLLGRITLHPLPHIDWLGTVLLPVIALLTGAPLFGWGKPVPVDSRYLHNPRKDLLWIAAAGPISNCLLAGLFAGMSHAVVHLAPRVAAARWAPASFVMTGEALASTLLHLAVLLNLALAFFNMIPVFPLDGGSVLRGLLPPRAVRSYDRFAQYGMLTLMFLFLSGGLRFLAIPITLLAAWLLPT